MAKLTPENRKWIIEMYKAGNKTQEELAGDNISQQAVSHILKTHGLVKPRSSEGKCLACGEKLRSWHNYEICGHQLCGQAYAEAAECHPKNPLRVDLVNTHFWGTVPEWGEIHYKDAGFDRQIKEYSLFNSKREHVGYHWELLKHGVFDISEKTGQRVLRKTSMKPIWDGVDNEEAEIKWYRPALDSGHTFDPDEET